MTDDDKALVERLKRFSTRPIEHDAPAMNRFAMKEAADRIEALEEALRDAAGMIGGPDDFTGLRDSDTVEHTITVPIGAVKKFRAALGQSK